MSQAEASESPRWRAAGPTRVPAMPGLSLLAASTSAEAMGGMIVDLPRFLVQSGEFRGDSAPPAADAAAPPYLLFLVVLAAGVLAVALLAWLRRSRRRRGRAVDPSAGISPQAPAGARAVQQPLPPEGQTRGWRLLGTGSEGQAIEIEIPLSLLGGNRTGVVLGRSRRNADLVIDDLDVSRVHARLSLVGDTLHLEDLGSSNGTRVGGDALAPGRRVALSPPVSLHLGAARLELVAEQGGRPDGVSASAGAAGD